MVRGILMMGICLLALNSAASAQTVLNWATIPIPRHWISTIPRPFPKNRVLRDLYEGLLAQNAKGEAFIPARCLLFGIFREDGKVYYLSICATAQKWSNGDPVTAGDF